MSEFSYTVQVKDEKAGIVIIENAYVNSTGLNALLQHMLDLSKHHRNIFMTGLNTDGTRVYSSRGYHPKPYTLSAIKVVS